ncbi:YchJ family protein [Moellerella wisconsensis]|uniref:YchJ family protein n=1 Tax=Moellerella wisconsensis TaxID=158849 RepID=A0ACD3Y576_9GAMM|nr:YchJ family protein [Moellerella wisconsensis]UNH37589.1 YchJ family protein [Moellerella wisconsensis]
MEDSVHQDCFCGSQKTFNVCCQPFLDHQQVPETAEALMRSRYSAYVTHNADYLLQTWHPECHAEQWQDELINGFAHTQWLGLRVISSSHDKNSDLAYVEFSACFIDEKADHKQLIHEHSRFVRVGQQWLYIDGVTPKVGRNDLCPCGSERKYKKCCGDN